MENFNIEDSKLPTNIAGVSNSSSQTIHGLFDTISGRLYGLSTQYETVQFMTQYIGVPIYRINRTVSGRSAVLIDRVKITKPWLWRFDPEINKLIEDWNIAEKESYGMRIVSEKMAVLDLIHFWVLTRRQMIIKTNPIQYLILEQKKKEAEQFLLDPSQNYPYLEQYAEIYNITREEAADRILIQARTQNQILFNTEGLRLKYQKAILDCSTVAEISALKMDFFVERAKQVKDNFIFD